MKPKQIGTLAVLLSSLILGAAGAAEITVAPGSGTLAMAIGGAASGDTLLLQDGGYSGTVTVNKSLTIRAVNRATNAVVYGPVYIDGIGPNGVGISVTLQGLKFSGDVSPKRAAAVRILENEWLSGDLYCYYYRSSEGDGSLVIVGNRFAVGSNIRYVYTDGVYIAGNSLFGGYIETYGFAWIVGNDIRSSTNGVAITTKASGGSAFILANRVICPQGNTSGTYACIYAGSSFNLVAGNIVQVPDPYPLSSGGPVGIYAADSGEATILNNVIQGIWTDWNKADSDAISVHATGGRVAGNIVVDWISETGTPINAPATFPLTHNLCFNTAWSCPTGSGNLDADPKLIDRFDFKLAAGSPAIDAGPPDDGLADLNRTRNDIGAHGGPWDITQYDIQRDPSSVGPYVYPLFRAGGYLSGGMLDVKALGVARLR